jgi:hypothetical protein
MIIFGLMTIINVRQIQSRLRPIILSRINLNHDQILKRIPSKKRLKKRIDRHLLLMLFVQIFLLIILTFPQAIQKLYSTYTFQLNKTALGNAIDNFLYGFLLLLTYIASGIPFYINILCGGKIFRNAFFNIPKFIYRN